MANDDMIELVTIGDDVAEAAIAPRIGGGLASYDLIEDGRKENIFWPARSLDRSRPFDLAFINLVPWSGRISGGGFRFAGRFHPLAPNVESELLPIHGNGFSSIWTLSEKTPSEARLTLRSDGPGPYLYDAEVCYSLWGGALSLRLSVTHRGKAPAPYGLGLHPWFRRTPTTQLQAPAQRATLEDHQHLPAGQIDVATRESWNFNRARRLPGAWINNDFSPWPGKARILWPERSLSLEIDTEDDQSLTSYILYSPAANAEFFCFEPVTHLVDAHNRAGGQEANGLKTLQSDQSLSVTCKFSPERL
jgi:aldose 1-epimerase